MRVSALGAWPTGGWRYITSDFSCLRKETIFLNDLFFKESKLDFFSFSFEKGH